MHSDATTAAAAAFRGPTMAGGAGTASSSLVGACLARVLAPASFSRALLQQEGQP